MEKSSLPSWALNAVSSACDSDEWQQLLILIHQNVKVKIKAAGFDQLCELSSLEQSNLIEREFHELQQSDSYALRKFNSSLAHRADDELLRIIRSDNKEHNASNVENLLNVCSQAIFDILDASPPELSSLANLFLNRPLPVCLRYRIWLSSLGVYDTPPAEPIQDKAPTITSATSNFSNPYSRIPPSLEVMFARRIHSSLDMHFPTISSRQTAALLKTVIHAFFKLFGLELPRSENDSFVETDRIFFLLVPCLVMVKQHTNTNGMVDAVGKMPNGNNVKSVKGVSSSNERSVGGGEIQGVKAAIRLSGGVGADKKVEEEIVPKLLGMLEVLVSKPHMHILTQTGMFPLHSHFLKRTLNLLEEKNMSYLMHLKGLIPVVETSEKLARDVSPFHDGKQDNGEVQNHQIVNEEGLENESDVDQKSLSDVMTSNSVVSSPVSHSSNTVFGSHDASPNKTPHKDHNIKANRSNNLFYGASSFEHTLLDVALMNGLSGLLSLETTIFVWDQCFVAGFSVILPTVLNALLIGAKDELDSLVSLYAAVDTFVSYCAAITVPQLQRLLTTHCAKELKDIFSAEGVYRLQENNEDILQALAEETAFTNQRPGSARTRTRPGTAVSKENHGNNDSQEEAMSLLSDGSVGSLPISKTITPVGSISTLPIPPISHVSLSQDVSPWS